MGGKVEGKTEGQDESNADGKGAHLHAASVLRRSTPRDNTSDASDDPLFPYSSGESHFSSQGDDPLDEDVAMVDVELVPIDHGYTIPSDMAEAWFEWDLWPQARVPFSPEHLAVIAAIDVEADAALVRKLAPSISSDSIRTLYIASTWLKVAAAAGWTPQAIANVVCRTHKLDEPSALERISDDWEVEHGVAMLERVFATFVAERGDGNPDDD